ncbi:hypothetical protein LMxysn_2890 [Listeria monocytogenes]|nr:hypothetical protein LMxysn_2890 [Listeria monocytogenes]
MSAGYPFDKDGDIVIDKEEKFHLHIKRLKKKKVKNYNM